MAAASGALPPGERRRGMTNLEKKYTSTMYKGKPLLYWAVKWFKMSNDSFFDFYGFNFNPHDYSGLYELARKKVYGE